MAKLIKNILIVTPRLAQQVRMMNIIIIIITRFIVCLIAIVRIVSRCGVEDWGGVCLKEGENKNTHTHTEVLYKDI